MGLGSEKVGRRMNLRKGISGVRSEEEETSIGLGFRGGGSGKGSILFFVGF